MPACAGRKLANLIIMFWVYILKSINNSWFYVGMSSNPDMRLIQHNTGQVRSTKSRKPYIIIYRKEFKQVDVARDFEKYLKIRSNKETVLKKLGYL